MKVKQENPPHTRRHKKLSSSTDDEQPSQKLSPLHSSNTLCKYKTEMCRNFSQSGYCPYYSKCQFAHGIDELHKSEPTKNGFYRTKACKPFKEKGSCKYGFRCQFSHRGIRQLGEKMELEIMKKLLTRRKEEGSRLMRLLDKNCLFME